MLRLFCLGVICAALLTVARATVVTNANDSGAGSLRQALIDTASGGTITFDPTFFATARTITLSSTLQFTKSVTVTGPGASLLTISGNNTVRCMLANFTGTNLTLSGLTIAKGRALNDNGGALEYSNVPVTIADCVFDHNTATYEGGAIRNNGSTLTISNCTFSNNSSTDVSSTGGAVKHDGTSCSLSNCTFFGNHSGSGGAFGTASNASAPVLTNCTFSGNTASIGGAAELRTGGTFVNCTIVGNSASGSGGLNVLFSAVKFVNTCLAGNLDLQGNANDLVTSQPGNLVSSDSNHNLFGAVIGASLADGANGNRVGVTDPLFAPLGSYGGSLQTCVPYVSSPAIDAGTASGASATDERGVSRPQGAAVDIGAVEQTMTIAPATITSSLTQNSAYSPVTFTATGGTAPYTWSLLTGALPTGMTFNTATQVLSGTPTAAGTFTFAIAVQDAGGFAAAASYTLTVAARQPPTISDVSDTSTAEDTPTAAIPFTVGDAETAVAALTVTGTSSNPTLVPNANIVFGGSDANRTVTLTPAANLSGTTTITLTVTDGDGMTATDTFVLTVTAVNDPPTISTIADTATAEDTATPALAFTVGDVETAASSLTVTRASSNTTLVPTANVVLGGSGANRTVTITPAANQNGTATITLTVSDGAATASSSFVLTVNAVNDAPTISTLADVTVNEDNATAVRTVTIGDVDTPATSLTLSGASSNTTLVPNANIVFGGSGTSRTVTVTPAPNQNGTATITLTVSDGALSASSSFVITVNPVNDAPTISTVAATNTAEDTPTPALAFTVSDLETAAGSLVVSGTSSNSTLVPNANIVFGGTGANRTVTVTPAANQSGTSTITLTVSDGALTATSSFVLTVTAVNDPPTITAITDQTVNEDTATGALAFTVGDVETAAGSLTVTGASSNPALIPNANLVFGGTGAARTVTITPAANQSGTATITLTVSDGVATTSTAFVLTVNPVNDAPTITGIADTTTNEDTPGSALAFTIGDVETPAASLTVTGSSSNPTLIPDANIVFGGSGASRTVTVTPAPNQFGTATITVTVSDGSATTSDSFAVTVNPVNDAPTITAIANTVTDEDTPTGALAFTIDDVETAAASLTVTGTSSNPTLVPNANIVFGGSGANRTVTVTPALNQSGTATITVTVSDGSASTSTTFLLTVNAVNDAPLISAIADTSTPEDTATAAIPFTVGDVETPAAALVVSATSSNIALVPDANIVLGGTGANRTITLTPAANQSGTTTITVTVSDGLATTSDTFVLTVTAVNDAPTISDIADRSTNIDTATGAIAFAVDDVETPASALTVSGTSSNPTLVPNANLVFGGSGGTRTLTVTPAAGQTGTTTISVSVSDGTATTTDTFVLTVVNGAPTVSTVADTTIAEDTATAALTFTVADNETAGALLTVTGASDNPTLVPVANIVFGGSGATRTVTVTPAANRFGTATITITASDGVLTGSSSFQLTVTPVNDPPTISGMADTTTAEDTPTAPLAFTVGDVETPAGSLTVSAASSNPAVVPVANIAFGGSGANRTLTATPAANQSGTTTITVTVSDGVATATTSFVLTVTPVNDPPTISGIPNTTTAEDTPTGALPFTVGDVETPASALTVSATSSNVTLVPNANFVLGGSGANRTITATPAANQFGTTTITVTVSDGAATASDSYVLTVTPVNDPPTISDILDHGISLNTSTGTIAFTVGDIETAASALTVTAVSSNPTLVPNANLVLGGSGANRTITVTPATNRTGTATITVTVSDGAASGSDTFVLTVSNNAPTVSAISNTTTAEDTPTSALAFTVADTETLAASLVVTASSDNTALIPNANLVLGGTGANRTLTATPAANQNGTANITLTVSDGLLASSTTFLLTVTAVNDAPTIANLVDTTTAEDTSTPALAFTVGDVETPAASLTVTATSSNATLVPNANLVLGGAGANRTLTLTPALNQSGTSTITVTVSDGTTTTSGTFVLTVTPVNDAPTLTNLVDTTTAEGTATSALAFTVGDVETAADALTVTGSSSNPALVPDANLVFGGSGANRTLVVTPAPNQSGTSTITVMVSDGAATTSDTFVLTVTAGLPTVDAPSSTALAATSATLGGEVVADGGSPITARGIVIAEAATNLNPRLLGTGVIDLPDTGTTGVFTVPATNLSPTTTYAYAAYATSAAGTAYSPTATFTTPAAPDTTAPSSAIVIDAAATLKAGATATVTIVFSEPVVGFANSDLTVASGTLSPVSTSDNVTFTATFTPAPGVTAATNVITLNNTGFTDLAGNPGVGTTTSNNYAVDTVAPGFTSAAAARATYRGPFSFTVSTTEAATFAATGLPAGLVIAPTSGVIAGTPTVTGTFAVPLTATDLAGNTATSTLQLTVGPVALTVSGITFTDKVYDGTTAASIGVANAALVGVIAPDVVTLDPTAAVATFADANVGPAKTVSVTGLALAGADAVNYTLTPPTGTAAINAATLGVTLGNLAQVYDGTPKSVAVNVTGGSGAVSVTYDGSPNAPIDAGSYAVAVAVTSANANGAASGTLMITRAPQTIEFVLDSSTIGVPVSLQATASSGLPVTFALVSGHGTVSGTTLTLLDANPVTVRATQAGDANHEAVFVDRTIAAPGKLEQTITFAAPADRPATDPAFTLSATASSGLPVTFAVVSGPATLAGSEVTLTGEIGEVVLRATQAGDDTYNAAPEVTRTFQVTPVSAQVFLGHVGTNATDGLALILSADGRSGTLLGTIPGTGEAFTLEITVDGSGDWTAETETLVAGSSSSAVVSAAAVNAGVSQRSTDVAAGQPVSRAAQTRTFRGHIAGGVLTGAIDGTNLALAATRVAAVGVAAPFAGGYRAAVPVLDESNLTFAIGAAGQFYVLATASAYVIPAFGTIDASGAFSAQSADGTTISGTIEAASGNMSGTLQRPGAPPEFFLGLRFGAARTDRLINVSGRGRAGPGERTLIAGFVIDGSESQRVLLRAIGPALAGLGVKSPLANPRLQLFDRGGRLLADNEDWAAADGAEFARLGAFGLEPGSRDAALVTTLPPGAYTMFVSGGDGVALAEVYDASEHPNAEPRHLINSSVRGDAGTGENALIAGFVITGNFPKRLLIRGVGPTLTTYGVSGAITDPMLQVYQGTRMVGENDNWNDLPAKGAAIETAARQTGAFALPADSRDAAIILRLAPGIYSVLVAPAGASSAGVGMIEIYEIPE